MTLSSVTLPERAAMPDPAPAIADDIAGRLAAAEQELVELEARLPEASLAKELEEPNAADALSELDVAIRAASRKVERLRMSHSAALARDAITTRKAAHEFRLRTLTDFETFLAQRMEAATEMQAAIAIATAAFHKYIQVSNGLALIVPHGVQLDNSELRMIGETPSDILVAREFWRVGIKFDGQGIPIIKTALPGARAYDVHNAGNPDVLPSLVDTVQANADAILSIVRDRVAALA